MEGAQTYYRVRRKDNGKAAASNWIESRLWPRMACEYEAKNGRMEHRYPKYYHPREDAERPEADAKNQSPMRI